MSREWHGFCVFVFVGVYEKQKARNKTRDSKLKKYSNEIMTTRQTGGL